MRPQRLAVRSNCPLCFYGEVQPFVVIPSATQNREYLICPHCDLVFLDSRFFLSSEEEVARYLCHENDPCDWTYQVYLQKIMAPLFELGVGENSRILDYGCGPTRGIAEIWGNSFHIDCYDPLFFPQDIFSASQFDFIICSEVVEHFYDPHKEWLQILSWLKSSGWVVLRTGQRPHSATKFKEWHYHRDPTHVCFYSLKTLAWVRERFSLNIFIVQ